MQRQVPFPPKPCLSIGPPAPTPKCLNFPLPPPNLFNLLYSPVLASACLTHPGHMGPESSLWEPAYICALVQPPLKERKHTLWHICDCPESVPLNCALILFSGITNNIPEFLLGRYFYAFKWKISNIDALPLAPPRLWSLATRSNTHLWNNDILWGAVVSADSSLVLVCWSSIKSLSSSQPDYLSKFLE